MVRFGTRRHFPFHSAESASRLTVPKDMLRMPVLIFCCVGMSDRWLFYRITIGARFA
jgi:hypothetical protein